MRGLRIGAPGLVTQPRPGAEQEATNEGSRRASILDQSRIAA